MTPIVSNNTKNLKSSVEDGTGVFVTEKQYLQWKLHLNQIKWRRVRACSHGGGGPQVGEVPHLGGITNLSIQSLFFSWLLSHERWGTSPRWVAWSAVPGNPLRWGKFSPCECWRWSGVMFSWAFIHYKTNWKADRTAKNVKFNAPYFG